MCWRVYIYRAVGREGIYLSGGHVRAITYLLAVHGVEIGVQDLEHILIFPVPRVIQITFIAGI